MELSFLIRILRELDPDYLIENAYDHTFHEVVMITGSMILSKLGINNLENDDLIKSTYGKVLEVLEEKFYLFFLF